jgi:hypothetical protein
MKLPILLFSFILGVFALNAQPAFDQSVLLENQYDAQTGYFHLNWNEDADATQIRIFKKELESKSWSPVPVAILTPDATSWVDSATMANEVYEYRVQKLANGYTGYGYLTGAAHLEANDNPGRVLIVVEELLHGQIQDDIRKMADDLIAEGWIVRVVDVAIDDTPVELKARIKSWADDDPDASKGVILIGHVPVPYSGLIAPDGHTDHQGAWPADGYYGDLDGNWTDWQVNNKSANNARHHNVPSDGKFDQSSFPSDLDIWVGRIDFSSLPAFSENEAELTSQYLDKLHRFKTAEFRAEPRALLQDNFGSFQEGFSQNGWKNFSTIVGKDNVQAINYRSNLQMESYMFSYGCGPGSYTSCGGISNTGNMATDSLQTVFTMLFGSYFGDFDSNNNFLRAALASGTVLTNMWAGRPHWQIHPMAIGKTIGYCARLSMNNSGTYITGHGGRGVHTALLGDPTLQWYYVNPPNDLNASEQEHRVHLSWEASTEEVMGYHVYRKMSTDSVFERLTNEAVTNTEYTDSCLVAGKQYDYLVRALDLVESASGSYYRLSLGAPSSITISNDYAILVDFSHESEYEKLTFENNSSNGIEYEWRFGDGNFSSEMSPVHVYAKRNSVEMLTVCLKASNQCFDEELCMEVDVKGSLPRIEQMQVTGPLCADDDYVTFSAELAYRGAEPLEMDPVPNFNGDAFDVQLLNRTGRFVIQNALGDSLTYGPFNENEPDPIMAFSNIQNPTDGSANGFISIESVTGGTPPYSFLWSTGGSGQSLEMLDAGVYWVDISDANGCTVRESFELSQTTATSVFFLEGVDIYPNPIGSYMVYNDREKRPARLVLRDINGRSLFQWNLINTDQHQLIWPATIPPGVYLTEVWVEGKRYNKILIKTQ